MERRHLIVEDYIGIEGKIVFEICVFGDLYAWKIWRKQIYFALSLYTSNIYKIYKLLTGTFMKYIHHKLELILMVFSKTNIICAYHMIDKRRYMVNYEKVVFYIYSRKSRR